MFIILKCWSPWNFNTTSRECIPVTTIYMIAQNVFLHILCWKTWCAVSAGRTQGFFPWGHCSGERWEESAFHLVLQAKPVSLWPHGNQQEGSWVSDVGLPLLPPRWCLPGSSFLARKSFYWLFSINYVFHIRKAENGKLLLFNYGTLFFWLVLLESWHSADFSIFIGCSNKIKLSFSSCIMQDWFSG